MLGIAMLIVSANVGAATKFSDWSTPTNLGTTVNSGAVDGAPASSKDGLSLYFNSVRAGGYGDNDIWVSQRESEDSAWGTPANLGSTVNTEAAEAAPSFSRDGHWMFFNSNRSGGIGGIDIWASYREHVHDDFDWGTPVNLGSGVNSDASEQGCTLFDDTSDGVPVLYFGSNRAGGMGAFDIYVSVQQSDGSFGDAELVTELSSTNGDLRPIIRYDGLELFLHSNRAGGQGALDLWVSTRGSVDDDWGTPVNLGSTVNSAAGEQQAYISSDGTTLYFASTRSGGSGALDLYMTTRNKE